jgi:hypothetical protein
VVEMGIDGLGAQRHEVVAGNAGSKRR